MRDGSWFWLRIMHRSCQFGLFAMPASVYPTKNRQRGGGLGSAPQCVQRRCGNAVSHHALGGLVVVALQAILVAHHLAIELVDQLIDRSIHVSM